MAQEDMNVILSKIGSVHSGSQDQIFHQIEQSEEYQRLTKDEMLALKALDHRTINAYLSSSNRRRQNALRSLNLK